VWSLFSDFYITGVPQKALKRIKFCYAEEDCLEMAQPEQEELCQGAPNASDGKLTLTKLFFSYLNSEEGLSTPYQFTYHSSNNYDYDDRNQDRWGRYQPMEDACWTSEYPYTRQDALSADNADSWAAAWHLSSITVPSGAIINIGYESDDYAFVQDRHALQMFRISGVGEPGQDVITDAGELMVFFETGSVFTEETEVASYLKGIHGLQLDNDGNIVNSEESQVYFKVKADITAPGMVDYISGYARIIGYGLVGNNPYIELAF
jgi:hypothetical protein